MDKSSFGRRAGAAVAAIALSCTLCAGLAGCATQNSGDVTNDQDEHSAVEKATIATRTVTFPAAFFEDTPAEDAQANLQEKGCTDIVANEDGSYTATMPLDKYNDLVDSLHDSTAEQLDEMPGSDDWPTITAVDYDDQFSEVTLTTSSSQIGLKEVFAPMAAGLAACIYQQFAGQPVSCAVSIVDQSGAELVSATYPDAFDQGQGGSVADN